MPEPVSARDELDARIKVLESKAESCRSYASRLRQEAIDSDSDAERIYRLRDEYIALLSSAHPASV